MVNTVPSIRELRVLCQATAPNPAKESVVGKFSRIFSIYFTRLFIPTFITPNHINILVVVVYYLGFFLFFIDSYIANIAGSLIVFFSIILDGCDGELARYRHVKDDVAAAYNEPVSHDIQYGLSFIIFAFALYLNGSPAFVLVLGALAGIAKLEYRLLQIRFSILPIDKHTSESGLTIGKNKKQYLIRSSLKSILSWINKNFLSSTGVFLILFISSLANKTELFLWFFAIGYIAAWVALFIRQLKFMYERYQ